MQKRNDRSGGYISVRLVITYFYPYLPLFRVPSSAQIPVLPEYVCLPSSSLSEVLAIFDVASFVFCFFFSFQIFCFVLFFSVIFVLLFPVLLVVLLCSRTRYADISLA